MKALTIIMIIFIIIILQNALSIQIYNSAKTNYNNADNTKLISTDTINNDNQYSKSML